MPLVSIAQPRKEGEVSVYWVYDHPVYTEPEPDTYPEPEPELPYEILSNCYAYVQYIYPNLPPTATILSSLNQAGGEVAVFYYPDVDLYHYAVVESQDPLVVTDTNYDGHIKTTRTDPGRLIGYYKF